MGLPNWGKCQNDQNGTLLDGERKKIWPEVEQLAFPHPDGFPNTTPSLLSRIWKSICRIYESVSFRGSVEMCSYTDFLQIGEVCTFYLPPPPREMRMLIAAAAGNGNSESIATSGMGGVNLRNDRAGTLRGKFHKGKEF